MSEAPKKEESKVETAKRHSRHLRGTIAETLNSEATHFSDSDEVLLKFHGSYQQDDRDQRHERRKQGLEEAYQFMVRVALPGGAMNADQYLAMDRIAEDFANGSLRVTTRQGIQFHGVPKGSLKSTIAGINHALLTTLAACGDVERNVMACPAPLADEAHVLLRRIAREIAVQLRPGTRAYHEIWLDGEKHLSTEEEEPFYGDVYLPRKFKSGLALADDNCVDIYSYDAGLVAFVENGHVAGFNVLVGGGMGMTHGKPAIVARLAEALGFVAPDHGVDSIKTLCAIFRDHGNRGDRRHSRIKYLLNEWGIERMRGEFRRRVLFPLHPPRPCASPAFHDHLGKHHQHNGHYFYGVFVENGRIIDRDGLPLRSVLRDVVQRYRPGVVLTPNQNLLLTDLPSQAADEIEGLLERSGVTPVEELSAARRYSMACPALPTCGLAMSESERCMPGVVDQFERTLDGLGMRNAPITLRMTGCPNGCSRPYTADIAFVGRRPDVYHVYVGGGLSGDRVVDLYAADVPTGELVPTLLPLLRAWAGTRQGDEGLSDFYQRTIGQTTPRMQITGREEPTMPLVQLKIAP